MERRRQDPRRRRPWPALLRALRAAWLIAFPPRISDLLPEPPDPPSPRAGALALMHGATLSEDVDATGRRQVA